MKRFFISVSVLIATAGYSQNNINQYEYWFDGNYASRQQQPITAAPQYFLDAGFSTSSLSAGLHTINLRFKDDSARYSTSVSQFFYKKVEGATPSANIDAYQYWFDNNFAAAAIETFTATPSIILNVAIDGASVTSGLHLLHLRIRDINNQWSSTISQFFYKAFPAGTGGGNEINAYQYWFDGQFDQAQTIAVSPIEQFQFSGALPAGNLAKGLHTLHLRFRDKTSQWSTTISQFVYITGASAFTNNAISKMQYWFDNHFDSAQVKTLALQPVVIINDLLPASTLTNGLHILHLRMEDTVGQWSSTLSQFFYKLDSAGVTTNVITGYRYWFNNDSASSMIVRQSAPENILILNTSIDMGCLNFGDNRLHLQFRDAKGLWSSALTDTIAVTAVSSTVYRFTGNGNWSDSTNWENNAVPALELPGCKEILIDNIPGGQCYMDVPENLLKGSKLTVLPGKHLFIPKQLEIR